MFPAAKASERTRARLVSPAKNRIKWRHFGANHLCPSRIYRCVRVQFRAAGTGHEKRRAFRESSIYIETCILQTPRMDNFLNPILYVTRPLFFCNFLNEPVRKRLLDRLKEVSRGLCQVFFKMQLPYGNYYTVSYSDCCTKWPLPNFTVFWWFFPNVQFNLRNSAPLVYFSPTLHPTEERLRPLDIFRNGNRLIYKLSPFNSTASAFLSSQENTF